MDTIVEALKRLARQKHRNFPGYIQSIQFPFYKNLEIGTKIDFEFPLTVFVGPNGCGKSSALQAVSCCPAWRSIESFWYETHLDEIARSHNGIPNCFFYEYFNDEAKQTAQILKTRIKKENNPEYWEPSRPIEKYGMKKMPSWDPKEKQPGRKQTRWNVLEKSVLYLDFRSILSAYDKYFYFHEDPKTKKWKKKQDLIRDKSKILKKAFFGDADYASYLNKRGKAFEITDDELQVISDILGKTYSSGKTLEHKLFYSWGDSTIFATNHKYYSEAFAGSGETSVVKLVRDVMNAPENSLILLDEPEVSLHPGAQKKLQLFLLEQIEKKRHQIVLCTHSPTLLDGLPREAIKVFTETPEGTFRVRNSASPALAFEYIGNPSAGKKVVFVEDESAKQLLGRVISGCLDPQEANLLEVRYGNGGAQDLFKDILVYSRNDNSSNYFWLDGDQKPDPPLDVDSIPDSSLDSEIERIAGTSCKNFHWHADSGKPEQIVEEKKKFLKYISNHVKYLPADNPEDTIWEASKHKDKAKVACDEDCKERIRRLTEKLMSDTIVAGDIRAVRSMLLNELDVNHRQVVDILSDMRVLLR